MTGQNAQADGRNNIIVQVVGNGNSVVLGYAHLTLTRHLVHRTIVSEVGRLIPYARALPLIGRDTEMDDLWRWLEDPRQISVRVITGRAGSGKTRPALELIEQAITRGWDADFAEPDKQIGFQTKLSRTFVQQGHFLTKWHPGYHPALWP